MSPIIMGALGVLALLVSHHTALSAQPADAEWNATLAKAKTQTLFIVNQGEPTYEKMLSAFTAKYGIKVNATVARPTVILPRVKTEQANGQYIWDLWWSSTSNMTGVAGPAGMLQPMEPFLILPEVKDIAQWRHPKYIWGDAGKQVFTHSHEVSFSAYRNIDVEKELSSDDIGQLLDPRLKGKIVMRDASQPNAGSWSLAPLYRVKGGEFVTKLLKDQEPRVLDNPQQIDSAIMRGGAAIALGMQRSAYSQCVKDGGCKNIRPLPGFANIASRGLSVFKNAPNPEATKIFLNWVLSKEGQTLWVKEWAASSLSGAISMRKDVEPHPDHVEHVPDFSRADDYVWVATQDGAAEVEAVTKIFKEVMRK